MVVRIWDGGEERVWCLACLRGRLLAERQASREAKEAAESMGNKLVDLEKLVKEEIKLRDKAERKLKFLKKKLESFNKSRQLDHSDSSEKCEKSCGSSSITSISKYSETSETKHAAKNSPLPEDDDVVHNHNTPSSTTKDSDSQITNSSSTNIIYSFTFQQKSRVASGARIKSLADKSIKEQHFTSRNFLEAEVLFMQVLNFEIGTANNAFLFLEELWAQIKGVAKVGELINFEVCMEIMDLLYEKEETAFLYRSPRSLAASVLVVSYVMTVPKQKWEFPVLAWVNFVTLCKEEDIIKTVTEILKHVLEPS